MKFPNLTIPAFLLALLAASIAVGVNRCNRVRALEDEAAAAKAALLKADEAHRLELQRVNVASEETKAGLEAKLSELAAGKSAFAQELARVSGILQKYQVLATVHGSTGPVQAGGAPSSGAVPEAGGGQLPLPDAPPARVCLLYQGDKGEIRVSGAALKTQAGNVAVVASGDAYRLDPEARLFGGPLSLEVALEKPPAPSRGPGWGGGLALTVGRRGWAVGPAIASPPLPLWRLQVEPSVALTLGSGGEFVGSLQGIVRSR